MGTSPDSRQKAIYITFPKHEQEMAIQAMRFAYTLRCLDTRARRAYWPTVRWMTDRPVGEPLVVPSADDVPSPQRLISGDPNTAPVAVMRGVDWLGGVDVPASGTFSCVASDWTGPPRTMWMTPSRSLGSSTKPRPLFSDGTLNICFFFIISRIQSLDFQAIETI